MMTLGYLLIDPGKSFMYILSNSCRKTEPRGTPRVIIFQLEKSVLALLNFNFTLCFLLNK
jgi:hypothetical protein